MSSSVLGSITIGYEPVWDQWRKRIGVRLWLDPESSSAVDANHLIESLQELWPAPRESCLLHPRAAGLPSDLLEHSTASNIWLEVPHAWLGDALLAGRVRKAQQRGVKLVLERRARDHPTEESASWFHTAILSLTAQDALGALRAALRQSHEGGNHGSRHMQSPVHAGQFSRVPGQPSSGGACSGPATCARRSRLALGRDAVCLPLPPDPARTSGAAGPGARHRCRRVAGSPGAHHGQCSPCRATAFCAMRTQQL